jgi:hypothetical protein
LILLKNPSRKRDGAIEAIMRFLRAEACKGCGRGTFQGFQPACCQLTVRFLCKADGNFLGDLEDLAKLSMFKSFKTFNRFAPFKPFESRPFKSFNRWPLR